MQKFCIRNLARIPNSLLTVQLTSAGNIQHFTIANFSQQQSSSARQFTNNNAGTTYVDRSTMAGGQYNEPQLSSRIIGGCPSGPPVWGPRPPFLCFQLSCAVHVEVALWRPHFYRSNYEERLTITGWELTSYVSTAPFVATAARKKNHSARAFVSQGHVWDH